MKKNFLSCGLQSNNYGTQKNMAEWFQSCTISTWSWGKQNWTPLWQSRHQPHMWMWRICQKCY